MAPQGKGSEADALTDEEVAEYRAMKAAAGKGSGGGDDGGDDDKGTRRSRIREDGNMVFLDGRPLSVREVQQIAYEETMAVLDKIKGEEESAARDSKIQQLEAMLAEAQKKERKPGFSFGKLWKVLWGEPPEPTPEEEAKGA